MRYALDACALIALFGDEEGYWMISELLLAPRAEVSITVLNICEFFYHIERVADARVANQALKNVLSLDVEIVDEIDPKIWKEAAHFKAVYKRLSLADAIGIAYTRKINGLFVTSDHSELDPLASDRVCKFLFFR
jgi:predicted nucleic acid-binding protein